MTHAEPALRRAAPFPRGPAAPDAISEGPAAPAGMVPVPHQTPSPAGPTQLGHRLRSGIETLSGVDMSGVRVHRNAAEPSRLSALAYTSGSDIYLGPGQDAHLPHEAWHVAQQRAGRVPGDGRLLDRPSDSDPALEAEADRLGARAAAGVTRAAAGVTRATAGMTRTAAGGSGLVVPVRPPQVSRAVIQRVIVGLEDVKAPNDVPDEWVDLYLADLTDDQSTQLFEDDIREYLAGAGQEWPADVALRNTGGNHWDVVFTNGESRVVVRTLGDGNCAAHATHAILHRPNGDAAAKIHTAPADFVRTFRETTRARLATDRPEIKARIATEVQRCSTVFVTGFGERLQDRLRVTAKQKAAQSPSSPVGSKSGMSREGASTEKKTSAPELTPIGIAQLLTRPAAQVEKELAGLGLLDRRALGSALAADFAADITRWTRLPLEMIQLTCQYVLLLTPGELKPLRAACKAAFEGKGKPTAPKPILAVFGAALKPMDQAFEQVTQFAEKHQYGVSRTPSVHQIFGHQVLTLYPIEKGQADESQSAEYERYNKQKQPESKVSMRTLVHRPILDLELVNGQYFARCYLGLHSAGGSERKDITADPTGKISMTKVKLMNLGNPFKALLWCEDYLSSKEHDTHQPSPILRSFLVPLSDADWMISQENGSRPLDQDRGSGQFGNTGQENLYGEQLHPVIGSLVSFFHNIAELEKTEPNQRKLPLSILQHYLTGGDGDPRQMAPQGVAAQHGRKGYQTTFGDAYQAALTAYYESLRETGFTDATQGDESAKTGKWKRQKSDVRSVDLERFEKVMAAFAELKIPLRQTITWQERKVDQKEDKVEKSEKSVTDK